MLKVKNHVTFLHSSTLLSKTFELRRKAGRSPPLFFATPRRSIRSLAPLFLPVALPTIYIYMLYAFEKSDPIRTNVAITDKIYHMLEMEMCDMVPDVTA